MEFIGLFSFLAGYLDQSGWKIAENRVTYIEKYSLS